MMSVDRVADFYAKQVELVETDLVALAAIVLEEKSPYGPGTNDNGP